MIFDAISQLLSQGVVTSPNFPGIYPDNVEKTETIQVEAGRVISLKFTAFDIEYNPNCLLDHLTIKDGDGTTLLGKSCGSNLPSSITSRSNIINLVFKTDSSTRRSGWSLTWSASSPGVTTPPGSSVVHETVDIGPIICRAVS